ncbi:MAG TPA: glucose-1-phosphate adenylyltransferase [Niabella sp.]|nr:glucose-1-phosphate adenylyltransferase [Chitinophagaceae bacterium]HRN48666.1 glucose-1-phosphate adenylyltransferase [Niabella sp.]HRO83437.1 glucose-1-phosphate adenylyltransferase [Niabella sp.]
MSINNEILAIILGGGAGTRLAPLTSTRSKPAVPIAGKYRLVDIPISNCMNSGINRMFVLTQFNSASLNRHIKNTYNFSIFSKAFVDILAAEQTPESSFWFQGTADAVRQSLRHVQPFDSDYILILSGDQLYQMDFEQMLKKHKDAGADLTIATIPVAEREAPEFGILKSDENSRITSFIEKPKKELLPDWVSDTGEAMQQKGRNYLASMGIYIFNRDLLYDLLFNIYPESKDFGKEIIPSSINNYTVASYQYEGYWTDIGNIYSFFEANLELTSDIPEFNLFDYSQTIYTRPRMLPPSKVSGSTLEKALISDGCIIHASRIENSVIGVRSRIGYGTNITSTYIMGADFYETLEEINQAQSKNIPLIGIGARCNLRNCIIDKNCRIGDDVRLNGGPHLEPTDNELYTVKDGIIVVKKGAVLPNGFTV